MFTLYHGPRSCSLGVWFALEEADLPYRIEVVSSRSGATHTPEHLARNPWGKVPALDVNGVCLSENIAIQQFIADQRPDLNLLPPAGSVGRAQAIGWMSFFSSSLHIAFRPILRANRLASSDSAQADVAATGLEALIALFQTLDRHMPTDGFLLGERFSLCDSHLLVYATWLERLPVPNTLERFPNLARHTRHTMQRPKIAKVLVEDRAIQAS